ncbi:MAG: TatD family hydrolase [Actinomycetes bacterium]|jgi:TatD DNase family protein
MADRHSLKEPRPAAPEPEPLARPCIDVHAHMELVTESEPDSPQIRELLDAAARAGIDRVVQVGYSAEQSKWGVKCAEAFPGRVLAAVALHPNEAPVVADLEGDLAIIEELARHPRVRAIGETGLDFFRTEPELRDKQAYSFRRHIALAKEVDKALVIHDRNAHRAVLDTLLDVGAPKSTIFHCYSGDAEMARECIAAGYVLSFAGTVTFKNAPELREAAKLVPIEQLLLETDSPFLAPMPHRGALNTPAQVANIARFIADVRGESVDYICDRVTENALRLFGSFD